MSKNWDSYYVVFLSGILSLGIPMTLAFISSLFLRKRREGEKGITLSKRPTLSDLLRGQRPKGGLDQKINVRFFLAANASLVLIALALELVPCAAVLHSGKNELLIKGLISIVTLASFAALGLIYSSRKGNMDWLPSSHFRDLNKWDEKKGET